MRPLHVCPATHIRTDAHAHVLTRALARVCTHVDAQVADELIVRIVIEGSDGERQVCKVGHDYYIGHTYYIGHD